MANVHARYLDQLEAEHWLDRAARVPADRPSDRRAPIGRPRAAHARAGGGDGVHEERRRRRHPADRSARRPGARRPTCRATSPSRCANASRTRSGRHRLRREITTTRLVNQMVNLSGISYDHRMTEDTGASTSDVARAWVAMREIFGFAEQWRQIDELGTTDHARHPTRPVPRLPPHRRTVLAVAAAPPPPTDRHRRRGRRLPARHPVAPRRVRRTALGPHGRLGVLDRGGAARGRASRSRSRSGRRSGGCCTPGST